MALSPFHCVILHRQPALPLTLIALDDWALSTITGVDSEKYIQAVTADVSDD